LRLPTSQKTKKEVTSLYPQLLTYLLVIIKYQEQIIRMLLTLLIGKNMFDKPKEKPVNKPYRKLQVDELPIIEKLDKLDYQQLLQQYQEKHGKPLKPVQRRSNVKGKVPSALHCPTCGAPSAYLYANNGDKGQYQCKVCRTLFNQKNRYSKEAIYKCPYSAKTLEKIKERKDFYVYKCKNDICPYYQEKINGMTKKEKQRFKNEPQAFKVRYIFRQFHFDYKPLTKDSPKKPKVDLSRLYASPHTLGLILTYHVNYGLSARKTAAIMKDIHMPGRWTKLIELAQQWLEEQTA
jgi:hypothetical protein